MADIDVLHVFVDPADDYPGFTGTKPSDWNAPHSVVINRLNITQTFTGTYTDVYGINQINVTDDAVNITGGGTGGQAPSINGLLVNLALTGGDAITNAILGVLVADGFTNVSATLPKYTGVYGLGFSDVEAGGTGDQEVQGVVGRSWCHFGAINCWSGVGVYAEQGNFSPSLQNRFGLASVGFGPEQGVLRDAGLWIAHSGPGFKAGILIDDFLGPYCDPTGTVIEIMNPFGISCLDGIDFSAAIFSGHFLKGPGGFGVTGDGIIDISERATPATPAAGTVLLYAKSDHRAYSLGSDGVERVMSA